MIESKPFQLSLDHDHDDEFADYQIPCLDPSPPPIIHNLDFSAYQAAVAHQPQPQIQIQSNEWFDFPGNVDHKIDNAAPTAAADFPGDPNLSVELDGFEALKAAEIEDVGAWLRGVDDTNNLYSSKQLAKPRISYDNCGGGGYAAGQSTTTVFVGGQALTLPTEAAEIDGQVSVSHLTKAYAEAMENKQGELAEMITGRISEKVSPTGEINDRLLYYAFQPLDKQTEYLKAESGKNFDRALEAFYRIFPYGMVAHFAANSAILETTTQDTDVLHIIDFDIGEGVQWPSLILALAQQQREIPQFSSQIFYDAVPQPRTATTTVRLTAVNWKSEEFGHANSRRRFEGTKKQLQDYASSFGVIMKVEEMEIQDVEREIRRSLKRGGKRCLAFNCMWGLPHMGRRRGKNRVMEFLRLAKEMSALSAYSKTGSKGILTFGSSGGEFANSNSNSNSNAAADDNDLTGFGAFFQGYMDHYRAVLESMEWSFPVRLGEARLAMEYLFVAPYIHSSEWEQSWSEMMSEGRDLVAGMGFQGMRIGGECLAEAREVVREGESQYGLRIEGENQNEMVLEWRGTPLIKVSAWR